MLKQINNLPESLDKAVETESREIVNESKKRGV